MRLSTAFAQTFALQVLQSLMSIATGVLIARGLGPVGQGTYATLLAGVAVGAVVASMGLFQGNVLAIATRANSARSLLYAAGVHGVALLLLLAGTQAVWRRWLGLSDGSPLVFVFALVLSLEVIAQMVRGINLGQHQVLAFNLVTFVQRVSLFAGVVGLRMFSRLSIFGVTALWAVSVVLGVGFSAFSLWRRSPLVTIQIGDVGRSWRLAFGHGGRALVVIALTLLLVRCDIWMLRPILGAAAVGQISVAIGLAEWLWYVPGILNNLLFATVAVDRGPRSVDRVCRASRLVVAGTLPATLVLLMLGRPVVERLYGPEFAPAGLLFVLLVPGMAALGVHLVIDSYAAGVGFPAVSIWGAALALTAKVGLNMVVLPRWAAPGAALVTSTVYVGLLLLKITWFRRRTGVSYRKLLAPTADDLRFSGEAIHGWVSGAMRPAMNGVPRQP